MKKCIFRYIFYPVLILLCCACNFFAQEEKITDYYSLYESKYTYDNNNYYIGILDYNFEIINVSKMIWSKKFIAAYSEAELKGKGWYVLIARGDTIQGSVDRKWIGPVQNVQIEKLIKTYPKFKEKKLPIKKPFDTHEQLENNVASY